MRVIFFGTPEFAVPSLHALAAGPDFKVALVVTQGATGESPVEQAAEELKLPVYKPQTLRDAASRQPLVDAQADIFVVAAFGLIFGQRTLGIPRLGAINIHPSLLPAYRGASPIAAAIAAGDGETGVSLMIMDAGIDTGAVISFEPVVVAGDDTTESLGKRLAEVGAAQLIRDVPLWTRGGVRAVPQPRIGASLTRLLSKADGWIDWTLPAFEIERHVRAMWPWPRAWTTIDGSPIQVHRSQIAADDPVNLAPGSVVTTRRRIVVACGDGALDLLVVEPAGRRPMPASAYLNGRRTPLLRLGDAGAPPPRPPLIAPVTPATTG